MRVVLATLAACVLSFAATARAQAPSQSSNAEASANPLIIGQTGFEAGLGARSLPPDFICSRSVIQGGAVICEAIAGASIKLNGKTVATADDKGIAIIGIDRVQKSPIALEWSNPPNLPIAYDPSHFKRTIEVIKRDDPISRFKMECGKISAQTPQEKRHAEISWVKKDNALKSFTQPVAPIGFVKPADGAYSSPFGALRTYVPATPDCEGRTSVHNGLDIAIGVGTEIRAPMGGTVILADPDLYYEGGCVFLDHGRGLVSIFMHMSQIDVKPGDVLQQGQHIGLSGSTGRVTGPHLHWAMKYRNVTSDDRGTDIWLDPTLLLQLDPAILQAG